MLSIVWALLRLAIITITVASIWAVIYAVMFGLEWLTGIEINFLRHPFLVVVFVATCVFLWIRALRNSKKNNFKSP